MKKLRDRQESMAEKILAENISRISKDLLYLES